MKALVYTILLLVSSIVLGQNKSSSIGFIENKGQIVDQKGKPNPAVKYLLNTNGLNVQLRENGFSYDVYEVEKVALTKNDKAFYSYSLNNDKGTKSLDYSTKRNFHRIDIDFLNSNKNIKLTSEQKSLDYDNYYNLIHTTRGITNVYKYQSVTYHNIYNEIDIVFLIPNDSTKTVEYNFIVKPGGKISDIQLNIKGVKSELIENKIRMQLRFGEMEEIIPMSWIENNNEKSLININYKKIKKNVYGFESKTNINYDNTIIIDPVPIRLWGTYYGHAPNDGQLIGLSVDNNNNLYYCGGTKSSNNIATTGSHQTTLSGLTDGFIVKFNPDGNRIWSTYFGGEDRDNIYASDLRNNELVVTGVTWSQFNIATPNTHSVTYNPGNGDPFRRNDCFIAKFNLDGIRIWGTYLGGEADDNALALSIDLNNNIIIVGNTYSVNGISTSGSFKENRTQPVNYNTTGEGFIVKFDSLGNRIWGSYFGLCEIRGVDTDSNMNIFFSGDVYSSNNNIATPQTHQPIFSYNTQTGVQYLDSFINKFSPDGERIWGTYYGGYEAEYNNKLIVDFEDNIYISGHTRSNEFIASTDAHQQIKGGVLTDADAYLAKFNQSGLLVWGTYYGGEELEHWGRYTIDVNLNNDVFLAGSSWSLSNISTIDAYSENLNGGYDSFIAKFNKFGNRIWGTYFGGQNDDYNTNIKLDYNGGIFIRGYSYSSSGITTPNSHQQFTNFYPNYFINKFKDCLSSTNATSNTPTCIGSNLELNATGGTNYLWNGPNGFTSTEQNPIITNVNSSHSGQYSCEITGTGDCDNTITIDVIVGDTLAPIPNLSNLPVINGDCNTVITNIPTANDNCSGTIIATTTSSLDFSNPGNYSVIWNYNDGNGNVSTQTQNIVINQVSLPTGTSQQTFCIQENATLNDILINGQNITWYDSQLNGNILANNTPLQNATNYYASQTINGCESDRIEIAVVINNTAPVTGSTNQNFCSTENATLQSIIVNGTDILWYGSNTSTTPLPDFTLLIDNTTYYATQTLNGCESTTRLAVTINLINTLNANDYSQSICDDLNDDVEIIDLTSYNSELIASNGNVFQYYNSLNGAENQISSDEIANTTNFELVTGNKIIYVRIDSPNTCFQIVELDLTLYSKPIIEINEIMPICDGDEITINAGNGFDSYTWSSGENTSSIIVSQPGNYHVTVTETHGTLICSSTKNFTVVLSNPATITNIETKDWTISENIIQIATTGLGDYEYSLDNVNFQDSNIFTNLPSGEYIVYVRDKNDCGTVDQEVYLLMYPLFFTPNGDGYNDKWKIKFSEVEPNLSIKIFDRHGKFIKQLSANSEGWDGTFVGSHLPSSDYWFVVIRENGKEYRGHFSLKR
ncbi:T9SS type B sorting domain-containing protein [Flavobacterium sp.]|uniref:DUF7948 domain-containing protein n=1 Tax=Flavobacterium sp. TaxID=239 RepID=UPI0035287346